jgi:hypothetical protein
MFYKAVEDQRYFSRHKRYSEIDWTTLDSVVEAFRVRFDQWYFEPVRDLRNDSGHNAFGAMVITCALIDAFSQFANGSDTSSAGTLINFIEQRFPPAYRAPLKTHVQHDEPGRQARALKKMSEVFWYGLRCGLLHQAHAMPYCGIAPESQPITEHVEVATEYVGAGPCPTFVFDPWRVFDDTVVVFDKYLSDLKNRNFKHDDLRTKFKKKFSDAFGKDISSLA